MKGASQLNTTQLGYDTQDFVLQNHDVFCVPGGMMAERGGVWVRWPGALTVTRFLGAFLKERRCPPTATKMAPKVGLGDFPKQIMP
jgi:hypothetical protein